MKGLKVFSQRVREWRKYLKRTSDTTNPNWIWAMDPPLPLPDDVKLEMMDEDSQLCTDIYHDMNESAIYGVEFMFDCLKADGFLRGYFLLKSKSCEIDKEEFADLFELLSVGDIFLQNCADMAFEIGADPAYIKETTGVCPREAGGMSLTENYIPKPHTQAKAAQPCSPAFLCNGQEQQEEPQGGGKGAGLAVVPNEPQRAAGGQEMGNGEPQQEKTLQDILQGQLKTNEAVIIFQRAIDDGLIKKTVTGLKWNFSNALLAYLCGIVYCGDKKRWDERNKVYWVKRGSNYLPEVELNRLFGVKNLGQSRLQLTTLPKGHEKVDDLLD